MRRSANRLRSETWGDQSNIRGCRLNHNRKSLIGRFSIWCAGGLVPRCSGVVQKLCRRISKAVEVVNYRRYFLEAATRLTKCIDATAGLTRRFNATSSLAERVDATAGLTRGFNSATRLTKRIDAATGLA